MPQINNKPEPNDRDKLKAAIKDSYIKCVASPDYFLNNFCYIQHPMQGKIKFNLYKYQQDALNDFVDHRFNIVLKGRQIGISTLVAGYCLWMMLFQDDRNILIISKDKDTAKNLVTKVKVMHDNLPSWLRAEYEEKNKLSVRFTNGSQIKAVGTTKDAGRSEGLSLLVLDEAAFIEGIDTIWAGAYPTLSTGGAAILLSTPNGQGNFFHSEWKKAEAGENGFNHILLDWRVHPDRTQEWRDGETKRLGEILASQEHDASFIFSGNTVIPPEIIQQFKDAYAKEPLAKEYKENAMWIWEYPVSGKKYVLAGDVSRGDGSDFSAFHVIDLETMNQVAEYKGKIPPKEYGDLMVATATRYNDALLIADNIAIGYAALQQVIDREYQNLFYMSNDLQFVDVHRNVIRKYKKTQLVPGFTISTRTRPLIINKLEEYMRDSSVILRSKRTYNELETFIWKNGKAEAMTNNNDDLVMALCIALWIRDTALRLETERIQALRTASQFFSTTTAPFVARDNTPGKDAYKMPVGEESIDISWLLG